MSDESTTPEQRTDMVVTDPEKYNRQQRFEEIHAARQRVTDYVAEFEDMFGHDQFANKPGHIPRYAHEQLTLLVSLYVMELLPLLERKDASDPFMSDDFSHIPPFRNLRHFALHCGFLPNQRDRDDGETSEPPRPTVSLQVFQIANRAYANLGMELDLEEEQGDAGFAYEDILEEGPPDRGTAPPQTDGSTKPRGEES